MSSNPPLAAGSGRHHWSEGCWFWGEEQPKRGGVLKGLVAISWLCSGGVEVQLHAGGRREGRGAAGSLAREPASSPAVRGYRNASHALIE